MKPYLLLFIAALSLDGHSGELLQDFSECRVKTPSSCDAQSDYAVERINCYKKIIEDHQRCERNVEARIAKEKKIAELKIKNDKEKIRKDAWDILEKKYEKEAIAITGDFEKKKVDEVELSKKFKSYNSAINRLVLKASEVMRPRVQKHLTAAHALNALMGVSLAEFEEQLPSFTLANEELLRETSRIIKNFESYHTHYVSEIQRTSQFDDNRSHYLKLMEESQHLSSEVYDMHRSILSLKEQFLAKSLNVKNRAEGEKGIKRGEFLVSELFKARKELSSLTGEEKDSLQVKVDFLTKYCLIEYKNHPQVCQEY